MRSIAFVAIILSTIANKVILLSFILMIVALLVVDTSPHCCVILHSSAFIRRIISMAVQLVIRRNAILMHPVQLILSHAVFEYLDESIRKEGILENRELKKVDRAYVFRNTLFALFAICWRISTGVPLLSPYFHLILSDALMS